jgi:predicted transcriptional regulator of viral defense system
MSTDGLARRNRDLLEQLHRATAGPFRAAEAAKIWDGMALPRVRRLLAHLAERGWLSRVRHGLYVTVPLGAIEPSDWRADSWAVAACIFEPGYVGGWTAAEHWGLTEQLFRDVVVFTTRGIRVRSSTIQGTTFILRHVATSKLFGLKRVWRVSNPVSVSDAARTVVDLLADPSIGGGLRHVADIVESFFEGEHRDEDVVLDYVRDFGNRAVYKRLGFIVETRGVEAREVLRACRGLQSSGLSLLDPAARRRTGRIVKRWNLRANVDVGGRSSPS